MPAIIGASEDDFSPGLHKVSIRRQAGEPYVEIQVYISRVATRQEFIDFHEREGLRYSLVPGDRYYEVLVD